MIDYQDLAGKSMPIRERRKLGIGDIFSNSAICLICKEEIRSKNAHHQATCKCNNLFVDGGSWYPKRLFIQKDSYKDTIVYYDEVEEQRIKK